VPSPIRRNRAAFSFAHQHAQASAEHAQLRLGCLKLDFAPCAAKLKPEGSLVGQAAADFAGFPGNFKQLVDELDRVDFSAGKVRLDQVLDSRRLGCRRSRGR